MGFAPNDWEETVIRKLKTAKAVNGSPQAPRAGTVGQASTEKRLTTRILQMLPKNRSER
jgi:hypothetical protein